MLLLLLLLSPPLDRWPTLRLLLLLLPPPPPQPQPQCSFAPKKEISPKNVLRRQFFYVTGMYVQVYSLFICKAKKGDLYSKMRVVVIGKRVLHSYYYPTTHIFVESNGRKQFPGAASA